MTRILYVVRGEPISPDYSGASSRYDQNFAALTRLYGALDVLRLDEAAAFDRTYAFEQQSETAQRVRQQAASWQDVMLPVYTPAHSRAGRLWEALADPVTVEFRIKQETLAALRDQIERCKPDLIWVEGTRLAAPLTKIHTPLPWILSQHDILSNVHLIRRGNDTLAKRWKLLLARRAEARVLSASPLIVTGSTSDMQRSQALGAPRVEVIAMAYESLLPAPVEPASAPLYIAHLGSLETTANRAGLEAYLRKVQPELSRAGVSIPLMIIGDASKLKDPLLSLLRDAHADLKGFVPDLGEVLRPFNLAILPYESDSGYRTKLPVLFNHAQVVVTTRAAVQGMWIDGLDQVCVVLDRLEDFPAAITRLLAAPDERERLGRAAHAFYAAHWTLDTVLDAYRRLIDGALS
ncbi:MAG: glycosyltransferase [Chloroflexota bacterium]